MKAIDKLWNWPDGLVWKLTEGFTIKSRKKKFRLFMELMAPSPTDKILDVGVASHLHRGANFLEHWYPWPENITALTNEEPEKFSHFKKAFPKVTLVCGDGRNLAFPDNTFDIVFSNAVIEHVGSREKQKKFLSELIRVGRKTFITTPNRHFPLDPHTMIPLAHWLPINMRFWVYRILGRSYWADINRLNLLSKKDFLNLLPDKSKKVEIHEEKTWGITHTLIAVIKDS